ncbi:DUF7065 domain-containing protein [Mycobacterium palustre]|uniref:AttH domain-containing protein n=1 Tax=Mycobacterium palustre TaxID=153971 RepID=A0A1X1ZIU8_9MYCO|nr:hypothetical protein [Mycobacterium palustre]MCV7102788.1 hypothetical protein [Mycobacterium palustre]ORW23279.1 hypothetical protein AWC19_12030 [Mycobacterium palustre]
MSITGQDDLFHQAPPGEPFWNEASWFSFMVPERDLSGFVYLYHRPNIGYTVGGIAAWDNHGSETYDCLLYDWGEGYQTPEGAQMFDFSLANGLRVELLEPLRHYRFTYRGQTAFNADVAVDLEFVGDREPHGTGFPGGLEEWGKGHYDQPGRMTGTLRVDGEVIAIDCVAQRDRSWGIRDIVKNPRGQMVWAVGENSSFHALAVSFRKPEDDPVIGTTEDVILGYYLRDGRYGDLTLTEGNTIAVTRRDESGRPTTYRVRATDSLGRRLEATGRVRNMFNWQGYAWLTTFWSLVEWELDGQTALGEGQDYWPLHHSRTFLRKLRAGHF